MIENDASYAILFGTDMEPERIRTQPDTEGARFVGIGAIEGRHRAELDVPLPDVAEIWGVVVRLRPGSRVDGTVVPVTMRTGEKIEATVLTDADAFGDPEAVIAEARYWELPVAYRHALSDHLAER